MNHISLVGLGFGDEAKGSLTDYLCLKAQQEGEPFLSNVRFNGGAQAAHNVVMADGRQHTFAQFGSGTFRGVRTILSKFMIVDPIGFMREREHLLTLMEFTPTVIVDEECLITTPWHMAMNRAAEAARGDKPHGSCGLGIGQTVAYDLDSPGWAPKVKDIANPPRLGALLHGLRGMCLMSRVPCAADVDDIIEQYQQWRSHVTVFTSGVINDLIAEGRCIFEGAQGVLLDENKGTHPHTTWSTTTFDNIDELVSDPDEVERIGVIRSYMTRHGAGPLPTEYSKWNGPPEPHNCDDGQQGSFRRGAFDLPLLEYAIECCGRVDSIALTHMDLVDEGYLVCTEYELDGEQWCPWEGANLDEQGAMTQILNEVVPHYMSLDHVLPSSFADLVEFHIGVPVSMTSWGPTDEDKRMRGRVDV